jgi:Type II secretion system (T2SS), protein G
MRALRVSTIGARVGRRKMRGHGQPRVSTCAEAEIYIVPSARLGRFGRRFGGLLVPATTDRLSKSHQARLRIAVLQHGVEMSKEDNGYHPPETNALNPLVNRPAGSINWRQYVGDIRLDPRGHPHRYEFPGKPNTNSFDLRKVTSPFHRAHRVKKGLLLGVLSRIGSGK